MLMKHFNLYLLSELCEADHPSTFSDHYYNPVKPFLKVNVEII